ncbi:tyrosine-type recombinase/integrase [Abyssicoccus albus]|uniref:tyrosine-type recombinase/integrase n=1 Tax=Abyssicoccus albus TaxID=1817405 RepID=UPI00097E3ACD|nr:site-specific integrase [Abyssicoccus albus]AQL56445.1 site-specific integrase [Abyssicoccus albus]
MSSFSVKKRTSTKSTSWMYDVRHENLKSGKKRKSGFKTKKAAEHAAMELIRELESNIQIDKHKSFEEYFKDWLIINNKHSLSQKQQYWYSRALELFLGHFGHDVKIKDIERTEYQKFIHSYAKGRTTETVRKVNGLLSAVLNDAVYDGYLERNPTYKIKFKGTKLPKKESVKFLTIEQYQNLLDHFKASDELSSIMLYLLAITGARFSEVNRMTIDDLIFKPGIIHLPGTKTENADREIELNEDDIKLIKDKLSNYPRRIDKKLFGLSHTAVNKVFKKAKEKFNIEDEVTPYSLRHTHASYLISKGVTIEYISKRLGHANISITLDIYTHLLEEHKKEQGDKVREIFASIN